MNQITSKIAEINKLTSDISEFVLELSEKIKFQPGQFVMLEILSDGKILKRAYSVVSYDSALNKLVLAIKFTAGIGTTFIFSKKIGDELVLTGSFGHFFIKNQKENLNFFATGIGLPPIICLLKDLFKNGTKKQVNLFFGVRTGEDLYYTDFLEKLAEKYSNFNFKFCLSREEKSGTFNGYVTNNPELKKIDWGNSEVYYCGSIPVSKDLKSKLVEAGLEKRYFIAEAF